MLTAKGLPVDLAWCSGSEWWDSFVALDSLSVVSVLANFPGGQMLLIYTAKCHSFRRFLQSHSSSSWNLRDTSDEAAGNGDTGNGDEGTGDPIIGDTGTGDNGRDGGIGDPSSSAIMTALPGISMVD